MFTPSSGDSDKPGCALLCHILRFIPDLQCPQEHGGFHQTIKHLQEIYQLSVGPEGGTADLSCLVCRAGLVGLTLFGWNF